jgi:molecular chaperone IbpA
MTSKQLRVNSDLINSQLYKMSVGFDRLFDEFFTNPVNISASSYPPYNVARITDEDGDISYEITLAVAGFTEADIEIIVEDNHLKVSGKSGVLAEEAGTKVEYIHKGIAERSFTRTLRLADHVEVEKAVLQDGILKIRLVVNIPEEAKPKSIKISKA